MQQLVVLALVLAVFAGSASAQLPVCGGVQLGEIRISGESGNPVTQTTLTSNGWTRCYNEAFNIPMGDNAEGVTVPCSSFNTLLAACGTLNSNTLRVAVAAPSPKFFTAVPYASSGLDYGGARFYYTATYSMGFLPAGGIISPSRDQTVCDNTTTPGNQLDDRRRLCFNINPISGGGRCGLSTSLPGFTNGTDSNFKKYFYGINCNPTPPCVPEVLFKPCDHTRRVSPGTSVAFGFSAGSDAQDCTP